MKRLSNLKPRRDQVVAALWGLHLVVVLLGALQLRMPKMGLFGDVIDAYCGLSGAGSSFAFFSPDIPDQLIATATTQRPDGAVTEQMFGEARSELDLRRISMMHGMRRLGTPRLITRSLAAYVLGREPRADSVKIEIALAKVPSMTDYRAGKRPVSEEVFAATYARRPHQPSGERP